ncbi:hypothetical protein BX661DRAFT_179399 [Kickxella alabastrina]|uniref:uncharacterized protein n=1 Tax=Kickxella alabastrina TaxID=61397 RepID=UPI0022204BE9|nr:uncharacterized protein BX661DRAFT_179399 [Kickxella alabastrina]KAI7831857.1 hypothetical protein BX661DRAFT_179399 [Kickxella alabastrina]
MSRPVLSLNLPAHLKTLLVQNGYLAAADFDEGRGQRTCCKAEVQAVADLARKQPVAVSAWALGQNTRRQRSFLTQLCGLDSLLGGKGIALGGGSVNEVVGQPGSGQTELCLRLCMAVQLPESLGGAGMRAVYVDTTGSFYHVGLREQLVAARKNDLSLQLPEPGMLLDGLAHELVALLESFDDVCRELSNVGLLVVNTVSWPFLASFPENLSRRQTLQAEVARTLSQIAAKHQIAASIIFNYYICNFRAVYQSHYKALF